MDSRSERSSIPRPPTKDGDEIDEIAERPSESIELPDDHDVAATSEAEHLFTFRHRTVSGRELLLEDPLAAGVEQRVAL